MDDKAIARKSAATMWENDAASKALGIEVEVSAPGSAVARFKVRADMVNGHDVCHGGLLFTLADTAFAFACNTYNQVTFASGGSIDFLRPAKLGDTIVASATEIHRGGRLGVYDVSLENQDGQAVAVFRGRSHSTSRAMFEP